ncbi:MAG: aminotransferase class V-fold PLP-dependent enzyme [Candidatus Poribacteria bacterium]|nr:aminotransferase class V-fold PLP-dependent enzyme [Candidatus Poribacteria bacterium]
MLIKYLVTAKSPHDEKFWSKVRDEFGIRSDSTYLNTGSLGLLPVQIANRVARYYQLFTTQGYEALFSTAEQQEVVRCRLAAFIGADEDEIAFTRNTTEAVAAIIDGIKLNPEDEVLTTAHEYPAVMQRWRRRAERFGIKIRIVDIPSPPENPEQIVDRFEQAITKRTRVIFFSHISRGPGLLHPAKALCELAREHRLISAIDGAQVVGIHPLNLRDIGCDFYANSLHKWALAPVGCGILFARREIQEEFWPRAGGGPPWDESVHGFELVEAIGTYAAPLRLAIGDSIDLINRIGFENIVARARMLSDYLKAELVKRPCVRLATSLLPNLSGAGLTSFAHRSYTGEIVREGINRHRRFVTSGDWDGGVDNTRVSTHFYNTKEEIDSFVEALDNLS